MEDTLAVLLGCLGEKRCAAAGRNGEGAKKGMLVRRELSVEEKSRQGRRRVCWWCRRMIRAGGMFSQGRRPGPLRRRAGLAWRGAAAEGGRGGAVWAMSEDGGIVCESMVVRLRAAVVAAAREAAARLLLSSLLLSSVSGSGVLPTYDDSCLFPFPAREQGPPAPHEPQSRPCLRLQLYREIIAYWAS